MILDIKKLVSSTSFKVVFAIVVFLALASFIFQAGVFVGFHKASFLFKSGDNFYRTFGERGGMMMNGGMFRDEFSGGHGAVGKIVKVELPTLVVLGSDNIEKVIVTDSKTEVREGRKDSSVNKLTSDQYITVLGTPNDQGQITAKLIRIMPGPMMMASSTFSR